MSKPTTLVTPIAQRKEVPQPLAPTLQTLQNSRLTFGDKFSRVLVTYCPENRVGAVYFRDAEMWRIYSPISPAEFLTIFQKQGFEFPTHFVEAAWMIEAGAGLVQ